MLVILAFLMSFVGFCLFISGNIPVSRRHTIEGTQARAVGCALLLTWPGLLVGGIILAGMWAASNGIKIVSTLSQSDVATILLPYVDIVRASVIVLILLLALMIAYWPSRDRSPTNMRTLNTGFLWFPFGMFGLLSLILVGACILTADLGKPCQTFACARLASAKTSAADSLTYQVAPTYQLMTNTAWATIHSAEYTAEALFWKSVTGTAQIWDLTSTARSLKFDAIKVQATSARATATLSPTAPDPAAVTSTRPA